eukprot:scaffold30757_cov33-Tisochrysis_lutea.AAC.2
MEQSGRRRRDSAKHPRLRLHGVGPPPDGRNRYCHPVEAELKAEIKKGGRMGTNRELAAWGRARTGMETGTSLGGWRTGGLKPLAEEARFA